PRWTKATLGDTPMGEGQKYPRILRVLLPLGVGVTALLAVTEGPVAEVSEIDAFQRAISSQSKADALAFIRDFGSSHLVPDLIELLQPDVALEVCSSLTDTSSSASAGCDKLQKAITAAPAAGSLTPAIPVSTPVEEAPTSVAVSTPPNSSSVPVPDGQQGGGASGGSSGDSSGGRDGGGGGWASGGWEEQWSEGRLRRR